MYFEDMSDISNNLSIEKLTHIFVEFSNKYKLKSQFGRKTNHKLKKQFRISIKHGNFQIQIFKLCPKF